MADSVTPLMPRETWAALERLMEIARGDSGQCRYVANFLLAWWNAAELGGFDFTDAWGVDDAIREDMATMFGFIVRNRNYPNSYGLRQEFEDLVRLWRPQALAVEGHR